MNGEMNLEQISIIIPVYNVEKYLPECIESVLHQTYKNLQIILVDDGSTDSSGSICERYSEEDDRIFVLHKKNGGLSDARNAGLSRATGEYIYYLDSDDFLEPNTIRILLDCMHRTQANIILSNYYYQYADNEKAAETVFREEVVLNNRDAMKALIEGNIQTFAWGKLISSEIAKKYLFPKDRLFEDHYWTHFVIGDADRIAIVPQALVYYRQRQDSISYTFTLKRLDVLDGWMNRKAFLEQNYPELVELCEKRYAEQYVNLAWLVLTRMKRDRGAAFQKMRNYNRILKLQNYADGETRKLICALDKNCFIYAVQAVWTRMKRGHVV